MTKEKSIFDRTLPYTSGFSSTSIADSVNSPIVSTLQPNSYDYGTGTSDLVKNPYTSSVYYTPESVATTNDAFTNSGLSVDSPVIRGGTEDKPSFFTENKDLIEGGSLALGAVTDLYGALGARKIQDKQIAALDQNMKFAKEAKQNKYNIGSAFA